MRQKLWIAILFVLESCQQVYSSESETRRIKDGKEVTSEKGYMVYLAKATESNRQYDEWICGGAIVTEWFIVTSAACVEDVEFMYAVAGTKLYSTSSVDNEECALATKRKITLICTPSKYEFSFNEIEKWAFIDIALVKVETAYDFTSDKDPVCTWAPRAIQINYETKYQEPNTDAMVLGWGHEKKWRQTDDTESYNTNELKYSSILIMDKTECKQHYEKVPELHSIIDTYMICAMMDGNIGENGKILKRSQPVADGCPTGAIRVGDSCQPANELGLSPKEIPWVYDNSSGSKQIADQVVKPATPDLSPYAFKTDDAKQEKQSPNKDLLDNDITFDDIANFRRVNDNKPRFNYTRKAGICQNDHGGPLVTWAGADEVLIGVASVFRLDKEFNCIGPYLFTSTQCNGAFLDCAIKGSTPKVMRTPPMETSRFQQGSGQGSRRTEDICSLPAAERGFDIISRRISWKSHPHGPAKDELTFDLFERPQIPLQEIRPPG